jgi:hypothetical protein
VIERRRSDIFTFSIRIQLLFVFALRRSLNRSCSRKKSKREHEENDQSVDSTSHRSDWVISKVFLNQVKQTGALMVEFSLQLFDGERVVLQKQRRLSALEKGGEKSSGKSV